MFCHYISDAIKLANDIENHNLSPFDFDFYFWKKNLKFEQVLALDFAQEIIDFNWPGKQTIHDMPDMLYWIIHMR